MNSNTLILNSTKAGNRLARPTAIREAGGFLLATISAWNDRRTTRRALQALDDRMLRDIGLSRAEVATFDGGSPRRI